MDEILRRPRTLHHGCSLTDICAAALQRCPLPRAGTAAQILGDPQHEYTQRLLAAAPSLSGATRPAPQT